ncbi:transmembrane protease serine 11B-like protein [Crotalus tigris]|uniref:transmembrane protease serine 11B-like protein n=1 Tax=Crotalus tigris TaxID=88082 RepID=UPI00192F7A04|nr:transmembrane protease serine 11B-like protein [Crotalus tigris]
MGLGAFRGTRKTRSKSAFLHIFKKLPDILKTTLLVQPTSTKLRYFEPWKILVILLASTIAAAIIVGFLTYFSRYGIRDQRLSYYKGNFKITGLQYSGAFSRQTSDQFRDLGNWIEKLMYETFHNSVLRHKYRGSRLVKVRYVKPLFGDMPETLSSFF